MVTSSCIIDVLQASGIAPCPAASAEAEAEETDSSHPPEALVGKSEEDAKPQPGPSNVLKQEDEEDEVDELADDDEDDEIVKREQALMVSVHLDHPPSLSMLFAPFFFLFLGGA
jgi:hypothetical protein